MKKPTPLMVLIGCACALSICLRVLPLPSGVNFSALGAVALLCGALIRKPQQAIAVALACRGVTDLWLEAKTGYGFYHSMGFDYAAYAMICALGHCLGARYRLAAVAGGVCSGAIFFAVSNFGVWFLSPDHRYAADVSGLLECYRMGLPFARGTFQGDMLFTFVFFSAASLMIHPSSAAVAAARVDGVSPENP